MSWLVVTLLFFVSGTIAIDTKLTNEIFSDFKVPLDKRHDLLSAARNISREITKKYPFITPNGHIDKLNTTKAKKCLGYFTTHHILSNSKHKLASKTSKQMKDTYHVVCGDTFDKMDALIHPKTATRHTLGFFDWSTSILEVATGTSVVGLGAVMIFEGVLVVGVPVTVVGVVMMVDGIDTIVKTALNVPPSLALYSTDIDDAIPNKREIDTIISRVDSLFA